VRAPRRVEFFQLGYNLTQRRPHQFRTDVGFDGDDACRQRAAYLAHPLDCSLLAFGAFAALLPGG
jgi:hypothetical protein